LAELRKALAEVSRTDRRQSATARYSSPDPEVGSIEFSVARLLVHPWSGPQTRQAFQARARVRDARQ
jgi:hypothetical protein